MEILPVVKLMEEDLEPLEAEKESDEEGDTIEMEIKDEVLPEVKTDKPSIPEEDIFVEKEKPKEKPKKEKKPRKPMTEAQLEHLRKGREKALAVRRAKAQEKKELKDLQNKKKKKDIQKLREEVGEAPKKAEPKKLTEGMPMLSQLDPEFIRKLQQDAIEGYDKVRKERKYKKKQEEQAQNRNTTNMNIINNALNPPKAVKYGDQGFFNHLF
jgi:hypothetical protein